VSLRARCASEGIENVEFLGPQSQRAMVKIMQASDIFLAPSRLEGLPKVTLEASAVCAHICASCSDLKLESARTTASL
jgi:glycosyltransferase involved in cell wall biosynthesis